MSKKRKDGSLKRKDMFAGEGSCPECGIGCGTCFGAGLSNAPREMLALLTEKDQEIAGLKNTIPLDGGPREPDEFLAALIEVELKARGLVRTAGEKSIDGRVETLVVRQWWNGLLKALENVPSPDGRTK